MLIRSNTIRFAAIIGLFVWTAGSLCLVWADAAPSNSRYATVLRTIACVGQEGSEVKLDPAFPDPGSLHVRYAYGHEQVREYGHDVIKQQLTVIIYGADRRSAVLYDVWPPNAETEYKLVFRDFASLEKRRNRWVVVDLYQGLVGTYKIVQREVDMVSKTPPRTISRSSISTADNRCWWTGPVKR